MSSPKKKSEHMKSALDATKFGGSITLKGGALNQGFKYWNWERWTELAVGKSRRRGNELEKKSCEFFFFNFKRDKEVESRVSYGKT